MMHLFTKCAADVKNQDWLVRGRKKGLSVKAVGQKKEEPAALSLVYSIASTPC